MAYNPNEPRDYHGRWIEDNIQNKIDSNKTPEEKLLDRIKKAEEEGKDSLHMYQDENGNFTPERQKLHEEIIHTFFDKGTSANGVVYNLSGASGNGKTTLLESGFLPGNTDKMVLVDPDKIKGMLPEYKAMLDNKVVTAASFTHEESSYISKELVKRSVAAKKDMVIDAVGDSGTDKVLAKAMQYKNAGYKTRADYVSLDTETSLKIVKERGDKTGRHVPPEAVKEFNREISRLVPELAKNNPFDELYLWDTNQRNKPRLVMTNKGGKLTIHDQTLYNNFLKKAHVR